MADSYVKHIEIYVNSSNSPSELSASVQAIGALLKNDLLTLETLVREMDLYLTTTDSIIRARGILLLGELLAQLQMKPLSHSAISSLIGFFTERLADWKALRGALVGCLALMRRNIDVGGVTEDEAQAVAKSYKLNLQVQSLGQHDRKLCLELLECLMDQYPVAVQALGDELPYMICTTIDEEKDPQCLMHAFHIVELAAQIFAGPSSPLANYAEELFDILGSYFPIHFTHPKGEDIDVSRDELSRALMLAFAATPLFEPYVIPLLLDKLSSSLPSTKVESLKYICFCALKYGSDRMGKHVEALWSSLKDILYASPHSAFSFESASTGDTGAKGTDMLNEALILLQDLTQQNSDILLNFILCDKEINAFISSFNQTKDVNDIPMQRRQLLNAIGRVLSVSAKSSAASCNRLFEKFFPQLLEALGLSIGNPAENDYNMENSLLCARQDYEALYLCIELLDACRNLVVGLKGPTSVLEYGCQTWCSMLRGFSRSLIQLFSSSIKSIVGESSQNTYVYLTVRSLQILATFPGKFPLVSASLYEEILLKLVSVLTSDFDKKFLWELVLRSLVEIGFFIDQHPDSERATSFEIIVVEKMISLISSDNSTMPLALKLQAFLDIGMTGLRNMLIVVQGLNEAIASSFTRAYVDGNRCSIDFMIRLLESYSNKVLPWFQNHGSSEDVPLNFALTMLDKIEHCSSFGLMVPDNDLLSATMMSMKEAVACCSEEKQKTTVQKGIRLLLSSSTSVLKDSQSVTGLSRSELSNHGCSVQRVSFRDEWIVSLFASVVIALHPETQVPDLKMILQLFAMDLLRGHISSAQALGSLVNKLPSRNSLLGFPPEYCLEEAIEVIFNSDLWNLCKLKPNNIEVCPVLGVDREMGFSSSTFDGVNHVSVQICCAIVGLAWIGKGLVLRGHERVKDITMTLFSFLLQNDNMGGLLQWHGLVEGFTEQEVLSLMKSAADAFHILMSDSEACLNRKYHAKIRPLYKQRLYSTLMPILASSTLKSDLSVTRSMLARSFTHIVLETPLPAIINDAEKVIPLLLDCLSSLQEDVVNKDVIYNVILVMSGILREKKGQEAVLENAHTIVNQLIVLVAYPYMMVIRVTAIQCLVAMSNLPYARIYPFRMQVLYAISKAVDDPKRAVREAAVRCRQAWASIASRSLHF